jgi:hypothetical protein
MNGSAKPTMRHPCKALPVPLTWSKAKASSVSCGGKAKGLPGRGDELGLSSGVECPLKGATPSVGAGGTRRSSRQCAKKHRDLSHCGPSLHSRVRNLRSRQRPSSETSFGSFANNELRGQLSGA